MITLKQSMKMKTSYPFNRLGSLVLLGAGLMLGQAANAAFVNGTLGFVPFGSITYTGATLGSATSITIPALEIVNGEPAVYDGNPNTFITGPGAVDIGSAVALSTTTLTFPQGAISGYLQFSYDLLDPGTTPQGRYVFSLATLSESSSGPNNLSFQAYGTLTDLAGYYSPTPAQFSGSFTSIGSGTVNASFSLNSPVTAPEPGTYAAGIGGLAIVLLSLRARR
jgi:hypothetical protein